MFNCYQGLCLVKWHGEFVQFNFSFYLNELRNLTPKLMGLLILSLFPSKSPSEFHQQHLTMEGPRHELVGARVWIGIHRRAVALWLDLYIPEQSGTVSLCYIWNSFWHICTTMHMSPQHSMGGLRPYPFPPTQGFDNHMHLRAPCVTCCSHRIEKHYLNKGMSHQVYKSCPVMFWQMKAVTD